MRKKSQLFLLFLLWLASACQTFPRPGQVSAVSPEIAVLPPSLTIAASPTSTVTAFPSATPTKTLIPTPLPTATPTVVIIPAAQQFEIFEQLWKTIRDDYLYADLNGLDWEAVHNDYRNRMQSGLAEGGFSQLMNEMIGLLGDDHSIYLSPDDVREEEAKFAGENEYVGIGVLMTAIPERDRAVILTIFPGSPAAEAGLLSRDSILQVEGEPILDEDGLVRDVVRGPEGSSLRLTIQTPGQEPRQLTLQRQRITGPAPVPYQLITSPDGKRIGYILVVNLNDSSIDEQVSTALSMMAAEAPLDGLILDNRFNTGGADSELRGLLSLFTRGTLGHFISRTEERPLVVDGREVARSQNLPLVILVGPGTVSYGEILSGVLRDIGRAYIIGETSEGNVETLWGYDFEDESRAWLAHESFRPLNRPEQNWEETGIIPDLTVPNQWDQATVNDDPAILSSLDYFDGLP
jgi:C-terminal peptidase prc